MSSPDGSYATFSRKFAGVHPRSVERMAAMLGERVARGRKFHCRITGDAEMRRLNRAFLGHDYPTDVLSFPERWAPPGEEPLLGDLVISIQRARAQARQFGHTVEQEIGVLMLHGLLHLLGMDHETDGGRMARAERRWRRELGLPGGLIERTGGAEVSTRRRGERGVSRSRQEGRPA